MYAFWSYDSFPYVLGNEVNTIENNGWITAKGYDRMYFDPLIILPDDQGQMIKQQLDNLRADYESALDELKAKYVRKAKEVAFFIPERRPSKRLYPQINK